MSFTNELKTILFKDKPKIVLLKNKPEIIFTDEFHGRAWNILFIEDDEIKLWNSKWMSLAIFISYCKLAQSSMVRLRDSTWYSLKAQLSYLNFYFIFCIITLNPNH